MSHQFTNEPPMLDITNPDSDIEIILSEDLQVLWINLKEGCCLRICKIGNHSIHITGPSPDRRQS
jgi:hypothetical protein